MSKINAYWKTPILILQTFYCSPLVHLIQQCGTPLPDSTSWLNIPMEPSSTDPISLEMNYLPRLETIWWKHVEIWMVFSCLRGCTHPVRHKNWIFGVRPWRSWWNESFHQRPKRLQVKVIRKDSVIAATCLNKILTNGISTFFQTQHTTQTMMTALPNLVDVLTPTYVEKTANET